MTSVYRQQEPSQIDVAWLEITGKCQLECGHCYADSGPNRDHGSMQLDDWQRVIGQLANMGAQSVQFIGGEPMLHPSLDQLLDSATQVGLKTEVYSNLVIVPSKIWDSVKRNKASLATSYYSPDEDQHRAITGRPTLRQTERNIARAVEFGIPVRAEIINVLPDQQIDEAIARLAELGVSSTPGVDSVRAVGRGAMSLSSELDKDQLCGGCTSGTLMVAPSGDVTRCIFTRQVSLGNVLEGELSDIVDGPNFKRFTNELDAHFEARGSVHSFCAPDFCNPMCRPMQNCMPWQSRSSGGHEQQPYLQISQGSLQG